MRFAGRRRATLSAAHAHAFIEPLIDISSKEKFTLALGLLFFACQRYFIRGIVMSGIKG